MAYGLWPKAYEENTCQIFAKAIGVNINKNLIKKGKI
jgi:hypothetical protein